MVNFHIVNWLCPVGLTLIDVDGGGGGGPGFIGSNGPYRGPGGGGGAYARKNSIVVVPGITYQLLIPDITVAGGGDASRAEFDYTGTAAMKAAGGKQAGFTVKGAGGTVANCTGDVKVAGTDGSVDNVADFAHGAGEPGGAGAGPGGSSEGGRGGVSGGDDTDVGGSGVAPGGGGAGGPSCTFHATPSAPGAGAAGYIRIYDHVTGVLINGYGSPPHTKGQSRFM